MRRFIALGLSSMFLLQVTPLVAAPARQNPARAIQAAVATIDGKAQIASGQALPKYLQLRDLSTGELVATTTCNSQGDFSFAHRRPGNYSVELVNPAGAIVATSAAVAVPAGATATVMVAPATAAVTATTTTARVVPSPGPAVVGGASTASIVTTTAVAAGIPGVVVAARNHPSPSF